MNLNIILKEKTINNYKLCNLDCGSLLEFEGEREKFCLKN